MASIGALRVIPGKRRSVRNAVIPPWNPLVSSVSANTIATSATGALVIRVLAPLIRNPSPSAVARVVSEKTSEPDSGSVMAIAAIQVPSHSLESNSRRCSSLPCFQSGTAPASVWAATAKTSPPSTQP